MAMAMATGSIKVLHSNSSFLPLSNHLRTPSIIHLPPHVSSSRLSVYLADASPSAAAHPWAEWEGFLEKLRGKGYLDTASSAEAATGEQDGGGLSGGSLDSSKYYRRVESACLRFARERPDLFRSLPQEDIKVVVEHGCPNLLLKSVHSAKRLRAYLKINEADVCSSCNLCNTCDQAYVIEKLHERANTVDLVHLLLQFAAAESSAKNTKEGPHITESAKKSIRKLLSQLIELSDIKCGPDLLKALTGPPKASKAPRIPKAKEVTQFQNVEMKREDWICTQCDFMNDARNLRCLRCKADGPKSVDFESPEMKRGGWTCFRCQYVNFGKNLTCMICEEPRPKVTLDPGWKCPLCRCVNFAKRLTCRTCGEPRPKETIDPAGWKCPSCDFMNDTLNLRCLRCKADGPNRVDINSPEMKEGDWTCPRCHYMNFMKNRTCRTCEEPRPKQLLDSSNWECSSCYFMNDARNLRCLRCKADGPKRADSDRPNIKEGDWTCPRCQYMNVGINLTYWTREELRLKETLDPAGWECPSCLRCKADGPKRIDFDSPELKKGDWSCPRCQYVNFGKDPRCWICEEPQLKETLDPADWECPLCDFMNDARNLRCLRCKADGPKRVDVDSPEMKKGDWTCPRCQSMNIGENLTCRTCEEPCPKDTFDSAGWKCPSCDFMNDAQNLRCLRCKADCPMRIDLDSPEMNKGDWTCARCQSVNIGENLTCRTCEESRPKETFDPAGWKCPSCDFMNDARNLRCLRCKADGPTRVDVDSPEMMKGEWTCPRTCEEPRHKETLDPAGWKCPSCDFMNDGQNLRCLRCKADGPKRVDFDSSEMKKGDWTCPRCQYMNMGKNLTCRICEESRPNETLDPTGWECPSCALINGSRNLRCLRCKADGPKMFDSLKVKKGDWTCPRCHYANFAKNLKCRICKNHAPKKVGSSRLRMPLVQLPELQEYQKLPEM